MCQTFGGIVIEPTNSVVMTASLSSFTFQIYVFLDWQRSAYTPGIDALMEQ